MTFRKFKTTSLYDDLYKEGNLSNEFIKIIHKKLEAIKNELGNEKATYGELFENYVAAKVSGLDIENSMKYIVKGKKDGGIDIIWTTEYNIYFIQVKLKKYDNEYIWKMKNTATTLFNKKNSKIQENQKDLKKFVENYFNGPSKEFRFILITLDGKDDDTMKQKFPTIDAKAYSIKRFLGSIASDEFSPDKDNEMVIDIHSREINGEPMYSKIGNNKEFFILANSEFINKFVKMEAMAFDNIFNKNIRNSVTNKIFYNDFLNTLKITGGEAQNFHLFNNGITMVASYVKSDHEHEIHVRNPQIVNGQQTIRTLRKIIMNNEKIGEFFIPIRIIETNDDNLITKIARYSNNQKAVNPAEIFYVSNDFRKIANKAKKFGYVLKGKKGKTESDEILVHLLDNGELSLNELIRAHSSIVYTQKYIGKSKVSITSTIKDYFTDSNKIKSLTKDFNFQIAIDAIESYKKEFDSRRVELREEYDSLPAKERNKKVNQELNYLKFGISTYYYLFSKGYNNPGNIVRYIYNEYAKGEINLFKNNTDIYEVLINVENNHDWKIKIG